MTQYSYSWTVEGEDVPSIVVLNPLGSAESVVDLTSPYVDLTYNNPYSSSVPSSPSQRSGSESVEWDSSPQSASPPLPPSLYDSCLSEQQQIYPDLLSADLSAGHIPYYSGPEEDIGMRLHNLSDHQIFKGQFDVQNISTIIHQLDVPTISSHNASPLSMSTPSPELVAFLLNAQEDPYFNSQGQSFQRDVSFDMLRDTPLSSHSTPYPNPHSLRNRHSHSVSIAIDAQDLSDGSRGPLTPPPLKPVVATGAIRQANEGRRIHPARFSCYLCPQTFTTRHSMTRHMSSHLNQRLFKCSICGQAFTNKTDCKRHEKSKKRHLAYL